ncbi:MULTISPECIES: hypothetical protein [Streptomyces]|nr:MULTISPECIES: hypothetical protein [Streptomyces]KOT35485.1 hypothetical protein ADK84_21545 [Streptomyces sp. NRRL WC-3701]KOT45807.1 hypothetical protein ADK42_02295 [Streptomyces rimosus subsp. rimosus]KOT52674.1 hypothetical protein ADK44_30895 [Streptomyces rimosus subsp. rimosus]KOT53908.1 hypothetical protein ADK45_31535 [Streptomyces rimosus subsp. rimosus]KOT71382.1 hypothetical protein ADK47_32170 [Streptomyces rimosus subsp. rimosus]
MLPRVQEPNQSLTCFVIGPIGDSYATNGTAEREAYEHHLRIFEQVIAPACQKYGVVAERSDCIPHAGDINEQICRHVIQSDLVIADVSGGNPNVMYELGLRHITGKPTVHIGEHGQLPFDIASIRTIRYHASRSGLADARRDIENALEVGLRDGFEPLTPARVLRGIEAVDGAPSSSEDCGKEDEDSPGLLDEFAAIEDGLGEMTADMEAISKTIETIGALTEQSNTELVGLTQANAPASTRLAAVARYAQSISVPAEELNSTAQAFAGKMSPLDSGVRAALGLVEATPPGERDEEAAEFLVQLIDLAASAEESMAHLSGFGTAADGLVGVSRYLRRPVRNITAAVKQVASVMTCVEDWATKARALTLTTE